MDHLKVSWEIWKSNRKSYASDQVWQLITLKPYVRLSSNFAVRKPLVYTTFSMQRVRPSSNSKQHIVSAGHSRYGPVRKANVLQRYLSKVTFYPFKLIYLFTLYLLVFYILFYILVILTHIIVYWLKYVKSTF